ncbi:MAG TPA: YbaB/EbfC family nucleoid-associated protein [Saprospiraceae bacterium]|nr:YbaB/EbfC family nucleoid-associated protein [Saprospiraceae bacterium]
MFNHWFGALEDKQNSIKKELRSEKIHFVMNGLAIEATADRVITNIQIDPALMEDREQLEDLMVVTMNEVLKKISEKETEISQRMLKDMIPPGFDSLFGG